MSSIPKLVLSIITAASAVTPSKYNSIKAAAWAVKKGFASEAKSAGREPGARG
jgi:hypothetical protein